MPALGEEFRSAREARGLTLSQVAEQIYIRSVYLNAIEHDDWSSIGAPVYVRGFIRTYARFLGLDGEAAVERFNQSIPPERANPVGTAAGVERERAAGPSLGAIVGTIVAVLLVAFVGYEWWSYASGGGAGRGPSAEVTQAPGAAAVAVATGAAAKATPGSPSAPSPAATKQPVGQHQLAIRLTQRSWLRVMVDGDTKLEGLFPAGTVRTFRGRVAEVRAGNAGGVTLAVNGRQAAAMGNVGDVADARLKL